MEERKNAVKIGDRCGRLTVTGIGRTKKKAVVFCKCDCGVKTSVTIYTFRYSLESGRGTQSCGCLKGERLSEYNRKVKPGKTHGQSRTPTYRTWLNMLERCRNENASGYEWYGAIGITVCERWMEPHKGYLNFLKDMGKKPSSKHNIDRIDNSKGYSPDNCRWVTTHQQATNIVRKNKYGYRGIVPSNRSRGKWIAKIRIPNRSITLGLYEEKEEAALAYNIASDILHGEFGIRNDLPELPKGIVKEVTEKVQTILNKL